MEQMDINKLSDKAKEFLFVKDNKGELKLSEFGCMVSIAYFIGGMKFLASNFVDCMNNAVEQKKDDTN